MALTDTEIKRAKGADEPYRLPDAGGLYLRVTPPGGKLWRWKYRFDGKQKLMTLGKYPEVSLARVRERHSEQRAILAEGIDPMAKRKAINTAVRVATENSFATGGARWLTTSSMTRRWSASLQSA